MSDSGKEKVFISWSGDASKAVAGELRELIKLAFDNIEPFVSDKDIPIGTRGYEVIKANLQGSKTAIIIVTPDNHDKAWLNFEAGAISNQVTDANEAVIPFLVGLEPTDIQGPISQFQAVKVDQAGLALVFERLAGIAGIDKSVATKRLGNAGGEFLTKIAGIEKKQPASKATKITQEEMVREILSVVRAINRNGIGLPPEGVIQSYSTRDEAQLHAASEEAVRLISRRLGPSSIARVEYGPSSSIIVHLSEPIPETMRENIEEIASREVGKVLKLIDLSDRRNVLHSESKREFSARRRTRLSEKDMIYATHSDDPENDDMV